MSENNSNPVLITVIICVSVLIIAIGAGIIFLVAHNQSASEPVVSEVETVDQAEMTKEENSGANDDTSADQSSGYDSGDTTTKYTLYVVNCNEWISLRPEPNTKSGRLTKMPLGASCGFIEKSINGFSKVAYNGLVGYALDQYLSTEKDVSVPNTQVMYVVNCNESITLRPSASVSSGEITQIPLGSSVEYLGTASNGFYKVRYNGSVGYALSQYLSTSRQSSNTAPSTTIMHVVDCNEFITLRPEPSVSSGEITKIPLGATVEYIETASNGFYKVRYNGSVGYALSQYLR